MNFISKYFRLISYIFLPIFLLTISTTKAVELSNSYFCSADESTGFYFKNGKWGQATFDVKDTKFIIRQLKEDEKKFAIEVLNLKPNSVLYGVAPLGSDNVHFYCPELVDFNVCTSLIGTFKFSPKLGRYIESYMHGYWDGDDNNINTPNITRGRCSKM